MRTAQQRYETKGNLTSDRVWGYQYDAFGRQIERRTFDSPVTTDAAVVRHGTQPVRPAITIIAPWRMPTA
jgi:YD repeat-containing protein